MYNLFCLELLTKNIISISIYEAFHDFRPISQRIEDSPLLLLIFIGFGIAIKSSYRRKGLKPIYSFQVFLI